MILAAAERCRTEILIRLQHFFPGAIEPDPKDFHFVDKRDRRLFIVAPGHVFDWDASDEKVRDLTHDLDLGGSHRIGIGFRS